MSTIRTWFRPRFRAEEGATAVEYGVMVALIIAVIVGIVLILGNQVKEGFCGTAEELANSEAITTTAAGECP